MLEGSLVQGQVMVDQNEGDRDGGVEANWNALGDPKP